MTAEAKNRKSQFTPEEIQELRDYAAALSYWEKHKSDKLTEEDRFTLPVLDAHIASKILDIYDIGYTTIYQSKPGQITEILPETTPRGKKAYSYEQLRDALNELLEDDTEARQIAKVFSDYGENTPLFVPTNKKLQHAFSDIPNDNAFIVKGIRSAIPTVSSDGKFTIDDKQMTIDDLSEDTQKQAQAKTPPVEDEADMLLLRFFASVVEQARRSGNTGLITVSLFDFADAMNISLKHSKTPKEAQDRIQSFISRIEKLKEYGGIENRKRYYYVLSIDNIDYENMTITFYSPWTNRLIERDTEPHAVFAGKGQPKKITAKRQQISNYVRPSLVSARNKVTAEIALYFVLRLAQHGTKADKDQARNKYVELSDPTARTITLTFEDLEKNVSEFWRSLQTNEGRLKTQAIKRAIYGRDYKKSGDPILLIEYLKQYTTIYEAYKGLRIELPEVPPSYNKMRTLIKIVHYGVNTDYQKTSELRYLPDAGEPQNDEKEKIER